MKDLAAEKCTPCQGGIPPLTLEKVKSLMENVPGWELHSQPPMRLTKEYKFKTFKEAISFVNRVAMLCEEEGHHANFQILYNRVILEMYTHKIGGLHENDFILAAKIDHKI